MNILLLPEDCNQLIQVNLRRPRDGKLEQYFYDEDNLVLFEVTKYEDKFRSWFLDQQFCQDGHLNILTRVDPLFFFIPQIKKYASEQFRTLQDICHSSNADLERSPKCDKIDYALTPNIDWTHVCDTKDLDGEIFVRFSEIKTLNWILAKHERTITSLKAKLPAQTSKATLISYSCDLIDLHLTEEMSKKFKESVKSRPTTNVS